MIREVLHFYIGCDVQVAGGEFAACTTKLLGMAANGKALVEAYGRPVEIVDIKPILRKLTDITEKEERELCRHTRDAKATLVVQTATGKEKIQPAVMRYLLSKHFDLFNLIESGQAITLSDLLKAKTE